MLPENYAKFTAIWADWALRAGGWRLRHCSCSTVRLKPDATYWLVRLTSDATYWLVRLTSDATYWPHTTLET